MDTVYVATYDSRHYSFSAVGRTEAEARANLVAGLERHGQEFRLDSDWFYPLSVQDDINVDAMRFGTAYRDHSEIRHD